MMRRGSVVFPGKAQLNFWDLHLSLPRFTSFFWFGKSVEVEGPKEHFGIQNLKQRHWIFLFSLYRTNRHQLTFNIIRTKIMNKRLFYLQLITSLMVDLLFQLWIIHATLVTFVHKFVYLQMILISATVTKDIH